MGTPSVVSRPLTVTGIWLMATTPALAFLQSFHLLVEPLRGGTLRSHTNGMSMSSPATTPGGPVFPTDRQEGWFDSLTVGMPRVHRYLHDEGDRWVMWYHGQDADFHKNGEGVMNIGTGRIGRADSSDGVHWTRTPGQMSLNSVLDLNTEQWWGFDTAHIGLGDVNLGASSRVQSDSSLYFMYYFGGNFEETDVVKEYGLKKPPSGGNTTSPPKGVKMRIGMALSQDGINWSRVEGDHPTGACLDVGEKGEWDQLFVGWPTVINHEQKEFRMYYHSFNPDTKRFTVGLATSQDGMAWNKLGSVFDGGPPGSFDDGGAGRRRIIKVKGLYHMLYEGVSCEGIHSIGLATSQDGKKWTRISDSPVFERSDPASGGWDSGGVTGPDIVDMGDGVWHLYYVGQGPARKGAGGGEPVQCAVGLAVTENDDFTKWERFKTTA
ncbi:unnamed protein product [Discosporangium mesarthrocarpum]